MANGAIQREVPPGILKDIQNHVRRASTNAESGWRSARKSEDTLTGHLGGAMQTGWSNRTEADGYFWSWRIEYRKFSNASEEPHIGADGIFQIEVDRFQVQVSPSTPGTVSLENVQAESSFRKGILFQAKKSDSTNRKMLVEQLNDIERLTPGNGCYLEYGPAGYRASSAQDALKVNGFAQEIPDDNFPRHGEFLADRFLECIVGVEGLHFDLDHDEIHFPSSNQDIRSLKAEIGNVIGIKISAFKMTPFRR